MPRPSVVVVLSLAVALTVGGVFGVGAQEPIQDPSATTTTTTQPETTTTTEGGLPDIVPTTTTTEPPPESPPTTAAPSSPPPVDMGGGDGTPPPGTPQVVPPDAQAQINSVKRTRANNTSKLLQALRPLIELGMSEQEAIAVGFGRFPVAGQANYSHDWWYPRFVPTFHLHEGTDIFAAAGTPVRAPADGVLRQSNGAVGGMAAYVTEPNGTYYYMAHLSGFVEGQVTGQKVKRGEIVGYNGDSGNARGGSPHVHFELHPAPTRTVTTGKGKNRVTQTVTVPVRPGAVLPPVDPKPYLDAWLNEALADVPRLIAEFESTRPRAAISTGLTRRLGDGRAGVFAAPSTPPRSQLLWASSASPSGGALQLAEAEAAVAAEELDWATLAREEAARAAAWERADAPVRGVVRRITPEPLASLLGLT